MRFAKSLAALTLFAGVASAQTNLTLDEAVTLARRNNTQFLQSVNGRRQADANLRAAYAALLPTLGANMSGRYQQTGQQFFQGVALSNSSDLMQSSYSIGLNYTVNSAVLFAPGMYRAQRDAAEASVTGQQELLRSMVTQFYINVLQAQAQAELRDTLLLTTKGQLDLAKARQSVGATTILDVRRAEVTYGQAEIAALQAHNSAEVQMLRLYELLGVAKPEDVRLSTRFQITPVTFNVDSLKQLAKTGNPGLNALRSQQTAAQAGLNTQKGQYLPTLFFSTGWGGQAQQYTDDQYVLSNATGRYLGSLANCATTDSIRTGAGLAASGCMGAFAGGFTAADSANALAQNNKFPFSFTKAPRSFSVSLNWTIFDGLRRETNLQSAMIQRDEARTAVKGRELTLAADVTERYLNLKTAVRTVELQEINAVAAREQLLMAEERYRVGAATFLEVTTSRGTFEQAQIDRINAIYDYHKAFALLENAVGRPLR